MSVVTSPAVDVDQAGEDPRPPLPPVTDRLRPTALLDRRDGWVATLAVTALAAVLRFWSLGSPKGFVFDEVYYAKDSYDLLRHGVELNKDENGAGFVVHPPLGKWFLAAGQWLFGHDELGWRFAAAVAGTLVVLLTVRVARRMFGSTLLGVVAGLLMTFDALEFVQSRTAMLDIFLLLWVVAAFACLVADRDDARRRLAARLEGVGRTGLAGVRWWRVGVGICLGCAIATKWSGVYYVALFPVLSLWWSAGARRAAGLPAPLRGALRHEVLPLVGTMLLLPVVVYTVTWTGWFVSDQGWDRHWAHGSGIVGGTVAAFRGWWHYHWEMWHFHTTLETPHRYQSHVAGWLLLARPVAYFYTEPKLGEMGCRVATCSREVLGIGTPAIWWASVPALLAMLWQSVARRDWRAMALFLGAMASLVVWIPSDLHHRTMFLFYALPALPFLVLALTMCAGFALGDDGASVLRRRWGAVAVGGYLAAVVVNFFWLHPILVAATIPKSAWLARMWFYSWI